MKKTLINYMGLLGIVSFISYAAAVIFAPSAYPGYDWISQAVSDLSADDSPSRTLWNQLAAFYGTCGVVSVTSACIFIREKLNKPLRFGIYMFTVMSWISDIGYKLFPLSSSGNAGAFQDIMHIYVITIGVVLLSIVSLIAIMIGGFKEKKYRLLAIFATIALIMMFVGGMGSNAVPREIFGLFERFSLFAATGFTAVLGAYLFNGFGEKEA